jgi:phosphatidylinositol glycan class C protein
MPSTGQHRHLKASNSEESKTETKRLKAEAHDHREVTWEKALWRKQPFADNYVPPTFLAELDALRTFPLPRICDEVFTERTAPRPRPGLAVLIFGALPVSQHLAVIALFLAVFDGMLDGALGAGQVGWACVGLGLTGYMIRRWGWGMGIGQKMPLDPDTRESAEFVFGL